MMTTASGRKGAGPFPARVRVADILANLPAPANGAAPPSQTNGAPTLAEADPANGPRPQSPRRAKGGRPRDSVTAELYEFCYVEYYQKGLSVPVVLRAASLRFGARAPKEAAEVIRNARRHAERNNFPWGVRNGEA